MYCTQWPLLKLRVQLTVKQVTQDDPVRCRVQAAQEEAQARPQAVKQKHDNLLSNNYHCLEPGWDLIDSEQKTHLVVWIFFSRSEL